MNLVRYKENEIPPLTPEYEEEIKALAEMPDNEIDFSDMPELDEVDFKYSRPLQEILAMSKNERSKYFHETLAKMEADRAELKKKQTVAVS